MITLRWRRSSTEDWIEEGQFQTVDSILQYLYHSVRRIGQFEGRIMKPREVKFEQVFFADFDN